MTYLRPIVVALGLFGLPAVALAGPHVDAAAATEDLRQRLGPDGSRWKLFVAEAPDDPQSRQVVVVSDDGDELVGIVSVNGLSAKAATARVTETALSLISAHRAALDAERRRIEAEEAERLRRQKELEDARKRRIEQERQRELDARLRREQELRQAQEAALAAARRRPEIRGFAGGVTRLSLGGGDGTFAGGAGARFGAWLADKHIQPVVEAAVTYGSSGDYLGTYGGSVGAGLFAGAAPDKTKGFAWFGAGVTPHVHWDRSRQLPDERNTRVSTEISAVMQVLGKGHVGMRMGVELGRPVTLYRRGDVAIDRGAVRFLFAIAYGGSFALRKERR